MGIFPNPKGQVTHKSLVGSCRISNPSKILRISLLPARMKKIQSKMKALELSQHCSLIFSDAQGQLTPKSVMESWRNSNSSQLLWLVLLPARMKEIHLKIQLLELSQQFFDYKSMGIFPDAQGQPTHKSLVQSCRISNPFEIFMGVLVTCKDKEEPIKNHKIFPIITLCELSVAMETRVLI